MNELPRLQEPDYIFFDDNDQAHILVPLVGALGDSIATDNTCKTLLEIIQFTSSIRNHIDNHILLLQQDIQILQRSSDNRLLCQKKQQRLKSMEINQRIMLSCADYAHIIQNSSGTSVAKQIFGALTTLISTQKNNCVGLQFSTERLAGNPAIQQHSFALRKDGSSVANQTSDKPGLGCLLRKRCKDLPDQSPQGRILAAVETNFSTQPFHLETLLNFLCTYDPTVNWRKSKFKDEFNDDPDLRHLFPSISIHYLSHTLGLIYSGDSWPEYTQVLLQTCVDESYWRPAGENIFYTDNSTNTAEKLPLKVQFFLAQIYVHCYANGLSQTNFGAFFDEYPARENLVAAVEDAFRAHASLESALFAVIEKYKNDLGLTRSLNTQDHTLITNKFSEQWALIAGEDTLHFDEFFVFIPEAKGSFVTYKKRISVHLSDLVNALPGLQLSVEEQAFLRTQRRAFQKYEGACLSRDFEEKDRLATTYVDAMRSPLACVSFLSQKTPEGQYFFEKYPVARASFYKDTEYWHAAMRKRLSTDPEVAQKLNLFFELPGLCQEKLQVSYSDSLINFSLSRLAHELETLVSSYDKSRSWWWSWWPQHKNRASQLEKIKDLSALLTSLSTYDIVDTRSRLMMMGDVLNTFKTLAEEIAMEPRAWWWWSRSSVLHTLVCEKKKQLIEHYAIFETDLPFLQAPEQKFILMQQNVIQNINTNVESQADRTKNALSSNPTHVFHHLNATWWQPVNQSYLSHLLNLSDHFQTLDVVLFLNTQQPAQFHEACIDKLNKDNPELSVGFNLDNFLHPPQVFPVSRIQNTLRETPSAVHTPGSSSSSWRMSFFKGVKNLFGLRKPSGDADVRTSARI